MSSDWIIGALAFVTIGLVIVFAVYHFGYWLKDPRNRGAALNVAQGGESATTRVQREASAGSYNDRSIKERLDGSHASSHPDDPGIEKGRERNSADSTVR
jgi:hypothetical protein